MREVLRSDNLNFLDKFFYVVSPKKAFERASWKQALSELRNYDAGQYDRLNHGWTPIHNQSGEMTDRAYRDIIRGRARDLERNSDIFNSIISSRVRNEVGKGLTLQVKTKNESLNTEIQALWNKWCKARNCDVNGELTFAEITKMIVQRKHVDGGILIYKTYTKAGVVPLQLQLLEVDELDDYVMKPYYKGDTVVGGIEKNSFGRPMGYWIKQYSPDGSKGMESRYIPKQDIIFYHTKTRPSQTREMSQMAPTITRIKDITSYMEAVSVKERIAACLSVFITKSNTGTGLGRTGKLKDKSSGYDGMSLSPGMVTELEPGEAISVVSPANQGQSASDYLRTQQRLAGAGQGLSYETTSRDMSQVNYSSARQGLIEDENTFGMEQQSLIDHVLTEVYESFVISAVVSGKINIPKFWEEKQEYLHHVWMPQARKWIDPVKEANANRIAMASGQKTFQQICNEQGRDWKEVIDDIATAQNYAEEKGVDIFAYITNTATNKRA